MLALILLALVALVSGEPSQKIVGGGNASKGNHDYICSLQSRSGTSWFHICGSIIYNARTVVTAAHCLSGTASNYRVVCGEYNLATNEGTEQTQILQSFTLHPSYGGSAPGYPNDIATMRLSANLVFGTYVNAGNFATGGSFAGQSCQLTGWGRLSGGGSLPNIMQTVAITKITNSDCSSRWSGVGGASINSGHACFYNGVHSACNGDSGGPARCGNTIVGVTSWGISTCSGAYPSVYTRVSSFASWLTSNS